MIEITKNFKQESNSIQSIYKTKDKINFNPSYQRVGYIWNRKRKQFLIDSILNGYDLPKFYFHYIINSEINFIDTESKNSIYAVIDGKQRLEAIFSFLDNEYALDKNFKFERNPKFELAGLKYKDLESLFPTVSSDFLNYQLDIVHVQASSLDEIESLFIRLNEGVPLTNPEKRNALGGELSIFTKKLVNSHNFFQKLSFENHRFSFEDLCLKLFIISEMSEDDLSLVDSILANFIRNHRKALSNVMIQEFEKHLDSFSEIFQINDPLLHKKSEIPIFFYFFLKNKPNNFHAFLEIVKNKESENKTTDSLEYLRYSQHSVTSRKSLIIRYKILKVWYENWQKDGKMSFNRTQINHLLEL